LRDLSKVYNHDAISSVPAIEMITRCR